MSAEQQITGRRGAISTNVFATQQNEGRGGGEGQSMVRADEKLEICQQSRWCSDAAGSGAGAFVTGAKEAATADPYITGAIQQIV